MWPQVAGVLFLSNGPIEDGNGVVCGACRRFGLPAYDSRQAQAANVESQLLMIVVAKMLAKHLGYAIKSVGTLNGLVRRVLLGGVRAKSGDGTWDDVNSSILALSCFFNKY